MKYKVIESTIPHFKNVEFEADYSAALTGSTLNILGQNVTLTQSGGGVLGGIIHGATPEETYVMYLQQVEEEPEPIDDD
jgi:hypothetical protein